MKKVACGVVGTLLANAGIALAQAAAPAAIADPAETTAVCSSPVCAPCCEAPPPGRFWASVDYLLWWIKDGPLRTPLVTTGPENVPFSGSLGQPGTRVLFGGDDLDYDAFSGGRLTVGMWLDEEGTRGVEVSGFLLEQRGDFFSLAGSANGQPFFGRPFVNALTGNQNVFFVSQNFSDPALSASMTGAIDISSSSQLWGWEVNGVLGMARGRGLRGDLLAGFRSLGLEEDLRIQEEIRNLAPGGGVFFRGASVGPGGSVATFDHFETVNRFYGPQLGGRLDWQQGMLSLGVVGKIALGVSHQEVNIEGGSVLRDTAGLPVAAESGGVLALPSNIGRRERDEFAVVPELGVNLGVQVTPQVRAWVGYTFLYCSSVARPGDQIDPVLNPRLVPTDATFGLPGGPARPAFVFESDDFWAHGFNFSMELRF